MTSRFVTRTVAAFGALLTGLILVLAASPAEAQSLNLDFGAGSTTDTLIQLVALITVLSLAPSILVMVTSFTRIVVVLSFLRMALGIQQTPPNNVLISLALFLTAFIIDNRIDETEAFELTAQPFREFMLQHVREQDLGLFMDLAEVEAETVDDVPLYALIPAFMISELRRAFEIGFLLFLPFLIIDMVVASILMSMGMMMLPPIMISLPFKIIFFVLVDGWYLIAGSLVQSYGGG